MSKTNNIYKIYSDLFRDRQTKLADLQTDPDIVEKLIDIDKSIVDQLDEVKV